MPFEPAIQERIIAPLRHAKICYVLSHYLAAVSLCGLVGEMIAVLIFDMLKALSNELTDKDRKRVCNISLKKFERWKQSKREIFLVSLDSVNRAAKAQFDIMRKLRNRYLHSYRLNKSMSERKSDTKLAYEAACQLVKNIMAHSLTQNGLEFNQIFMRYLEKKGIVTP